MTKRKCKRCGKSFVPKNNKQTYCNPICRIEYHKEMAMAEKEELQEYRKRKGKSIKNIAAEAKAAGMTYGQYVSKMGL